MKKLVAILLSVCLLGAISIPVYASESPRTYAISPRYANISVISLRVDRSTIYGILQADEEMDLAVSIKVYADGVLDDTMSDDTYGSSLNYEFDYDFSSGVKYRIEATYTAGTEKVKKTLPYNP
jgi:hypothetical protein